MYFSLCRQGVRLTIFLRSKIEESIYKYIYFSPPPSPTYTFVLSKIVLSPPFFCKSPIRSTKGELKIKTLVECSPFSCPFSVNKRFYRIYAESRNPAFILCRLTFNMLISKFFNLQSLITWMKCKKILVKATLDEYLWIETQRLIC